MGERLLEGLAQRLLVDQLAVVGLPLNAQAKGSTATMVAASSSRLVCHPTKSISRCV